MPDESASDRLPEALAPVAAVMFGEQALDAMLGLIVKLAVESLSVADAASITLRRGEVEETASATSERAVQMDQSQYDSGRGPCLRATRVGKLVKVVIEPGDPRWPEFASKAREQGFATSISVPILIGGKSTGALNAYSSHHQAFGARETDTVRLLSQQASVVISRASALTSADLLSDEFQQAMGSRETIAMAKGVVMAREGVDAEQAFTILRQAAQRSGRKLPEVAQDMVDSAQRRAGS